MKKYAYLFPFLYFVDTRLRSSSVSFHVLFEWLPAILLAIVVSDREAGSAVFVAVLSYVAFICVYEVGYFVNDAVSVKWESRGRERAPQDFGKKWIATAIGTRMVVFLGVTVSLDFVTRPEWWSFFIALSIAFAIHNALKSKDLKAATFLWLSWFRFMAPVIFVVAESQQLGIALAAAMGYAFFRLLGYLDSKELLHMPGRRRTELRLLFFLMPLVGVIALWSHASAHGFVVLSGYFAAVAVVGSIANVIVERHKSR